MAKPSLRLHILILFQGTLMYLSSRFRGALCSRLLLLLLLGIACLGTPAMGQGLIDLHDFTHTADEQNPFSIVQLSDGSLFGAAGGGLFHMKTDGSDFERITSCGSEGPLLFGPDGRLYAVGYVQPASNECVFRLNADGTNPTVVYSFAATDYVPEHYTIGPDGVLYGTCRNGGASGNGSVISIGLDGSGYKQLATFPRQSWPLGLTVGQDGNLYGVANIGGAHNWGSVWKCTKSGTLTDLYDFSNTTDGNWPTELVQARSGNLYGVSTNGGTYAVFEVSTSGKFTAVWTPSNGISNLSSLTMDSAGILYGANHEGGKNKVGYLFRLDPSTNTVTNICDMPVNGSGAINTLYAGSDGNLYGGSGDYGLQPRLGSIFSVPAKGGSLTILHECVDYLDGWGPMGLVQDPDGTLYGLTYWGGSYGVGMLYSMQPDGTGYTMLASLPLQQGLFILGGDGMFYTSSGKSYTYPGGAVMRLDPKSGTLTLVRAFDQTSQDPYYPSLMVYGTDGFLYGLAAYGGANSGGVLYRMAPDGTAFSILHAFGGSGDGTTPEDLILGSDGVLYGTTYAGGANKGGTVFSYAAAVGGYHLLASFDGKAQGGGPYLIIKASDGYMYGVTDYGGANNHGGVFRMDRNSGALTELTDFNVAYTWPLAFLEGSSHVLYCLMLSITGDGTLFSLDVSQSPPVYISQSTYPGNGIWQVDVDAGPNSMLLGQDGSLYGTAPVTNNYGLVFKLKPASMGISSLAVSSSTVNAGYGVTATVTLSQAAPAGGATIALTGGATGVSFPNNVKIAAGATSATFTVSTAANMPDQATFYVLASYNGTRAMTMITVTGQWIMQMVVDPAQIHAGASATGTVTLRFAAPTGGIPVTLTSSMPSTFKVPAKVVVPAGSLSATFPVATPTNVTAATYGSITGAFTTTSQQAPVAVFPDTPAGVSLTPSTVTAGQPTTGTVTLNWPAPTGGTVVKLASSSASAKCPSSVTVKAGSSTASFTITTSATISANTTATITGSCNGGSQPATLTLNAETLTGLTLSPGDVTAGTGSSGVVTISQPALSGGVVVTLSGQTSAASFPTSVKVAAGATSAKFSITTSQVTSTTQATIKAALNGTSQTATLSIEPKVTYSVSVSPGSVKGGSSFIMTITLAAAAPHGGLTFALASSNSGLVTIGATSATIAAGKTSVQVSASTSAVTSTTSVKVSAMLGTTTQSATVKLTP